MGLEVGVIRGPERISDTAGDPSCFLRACAPKIFNDGNSVELTGGSENGALKREITPSP